MIRQLQNHSVGTTAHAAASARSAHTPRQAAAVLIGGPHDPNWKDNIVFSGYFHGDNAAGFGAAHQTGWTGLVADVIRGRHGVVPTIDNALRRLDMPGLDRGGRP